LATPFLVRRAGHIRAFSALVAAAVVTVILLPAILQPVAWLILRGALGFVFAGLYSVIESWVNAKATNSNRGALYGFYQIVAYAASAGGQLALTLQSATTFVGFTMGGALIALSTIPLALTNADAPIQPRGARLRLGWLIRLSPVGALAAFLVGATNGAYSALGPVYALGVGFSPQAAPLFTAAVTIGSALGVYPRRRERLCGARLRGGLDDVHALYADDVPRQRPRESGAHGVGVDRPSLPLQRRGDCRAGPRRRLDAIVRAGGALCPECAAASGARRFRAVAVRHFRAGAPPDQPGRGFGGRAARRVGERGFAQSLTTEISGAAGFFMPTTW
jgi:hypothetical protein